jgi:CIC family chloride channel protein
MHQKALVRLRSMQMADLIKPAVTVLPMTASFSEASAMFLKHSVKYIYMVDAEERFQGVIASQDITAALLDHSADDNSGLHAFLRQGFLHVLTPDMSLDVALQHFLTHQGERLPIIRSLAEPILLGVVHKTSLLDAYARLNRSSLSEKGST